MTPHVSSLLALKTYQRETSNIFSYVYAENFSLRYFTTTFYLFIRVDSGLPGALYSICCLGVSIILESEKIVTMWPTNDKIALTRKGNRGMGRSPHYLTSKTLSFSLTS